MARLLLVTRNPALPLALATANIEFEQRRPDELEDLAAAGPIMVALDSAETDALCRKLVGHGCVGVIAAGSDEGMLAALTRDQVAVTITLPVSRDVLIAAVTTALESPQAPPAEAASEPPPVEPLPPLPVQLPVAESVPPSAAPPNTDPVGQADEDLVRAVRDLAARLPLLGEVAGGTATDAVEATHSTAAVVFLPDGDIWRVAAGVGLRPLELHVALTADDWLVNELARLGHGIVAENSMEARKRLMGVPLATWPQLLAVPIDGVAGLAIVARKTQVGYEAADLDALVGVVRRAEQPLRQALAVRDLARALEPWRDRPGEPVAYST